jgi:hypothetical protein
VRYPRLQDGEGIALKSGHRFRFMCCDCGLVHDVAIVAPVRKGTAIGFAVRRNKRSTALARRHKKKVA